MVFIKSATVRPVELYGRSQEPLCLSGVLGRGSAPHDLEATTVQTFWLGPKALSVANRHCSAIVAGNLSG